MKKIGLIALILTLLFLVQVSVYAEKDKEVPVSREVEEMADSRSGQSSSVVGEDIEIGEGEVKIVSVDEPISEEPAEPVVGEGIEVGEGEAKIVSVDEPISEDRTAPVVGEGIEIGEGEAKIVSVGEGEVPSAAGGNTAGKNNNNTIYIVIGSVLVLGAAFGIGYKKLAHR